ncbi:MAG: CvpA family protein [Verrucomicrobia bacterium]|nr:CvpA family protein [Verrucomicrobiota bacterium]MCF7709313.1 CvpA family protein [Verrucomicrobiota bacterium]
MIVWILAIVLIGLAATSGRFEGAIRATCSMLGFILGLFLAFPIGSLIRPIFSAAGMENPVWLWMLPPVVAFVLIVILSVVGGFFAHRKVEFFYRYRADDFQRHRWENLNSQLGLCIGVLTGVGYFILITWIVFVFGYFTTQVEAQGKDPFTIRTLNSCRRQIEESGINKFLAAIDDTPEKYYKASDILGLIYNNPQLKVRIENYPPFIAMEDRPAIRDMLSDQSFIDMLDSNESIVSWIQHPQTQALINNTALMNELLSMNLDDLMEFLKTGNSPEYDHFKILGRWKMDAALSLIELKKRRPDIKARDLIYKKQILYAVQDDIRMTAIPDKQVIIEGLVGNLPSVLDNVPDISLEELVKGNITQQASQDGAEEGQGQQRRQGGGPPVSGAPADSRYAERYNLDQPQEEEGQPEAEQTPQVQGVNNVTWRGTWSGDKAFYTLRFNTGSGTISSSINIQAEKFTFPIGDYPLVFLKVY